MTLEHCGVVDSEDGLLLFGDAAILQWWGGSDSEHMRTAHIEAAFRAGAPGLNITIAHRAVVIWDIEGSGTTDIFSDRALNKIVLVRSWLEDPIDARTEFETVLTLGSMPLSPDVAFAEFQIECGVLAILWPTESGECIHHTGRANYTLATQYMMTKSTGILLPALNGRYQCFHDEVQTQQGEARRCHVVLVPAGD
jgi:hypothetical protein